MFRGCRMQCVNTILDGMFFLPLNRPVTSMSHPETVGSFVTFKLRPMANRPHDK